MRLQEGVKPYLLAVPVAIAVIAADLWTKRIAAASFADGPLTVIPGVLAFTFGENPGASFSMFQDGGSYLALAAVVAVVVVLVALRQPRPTAEVVAFGLIMGGAVGNLTDRIFRADGFLDGHVIDWIQFPNFPIFNLADSAITISVVLLFIVAWVQSRSEKVEA
ncbi:MAG: signal peptidase II [Acidimicrobiia bacterium]